MVGSKRAKRRAKTHSEAVSAAASPVEKTAPQADGPTRRGIDRIYHDQYRALMLIPFLMLLAALLILGYNYATTGEFAQTGVTLKGGLTITVPTAQQPFATSEIERTLVSAFPQNDLSVREIAELGVQQAITVEVAPRAGQGIEELQQDITAIIAETTGIPQEDYGVEVIGPSLGQSFLQQTLRALFAAFMLMGIVVFLYFGDSLRHKVLVLILGLLASALAFTGSTVIALLGLLIGCFLFALYVRWSVPSAAVILAAFSDMVVTLAVVSILGVKISTAGIAAFLMLIGYSVDTDILLSTRVLKRKEGTVYDRVKSAIGTGMLMNATTLVAVVVALIISQSVVIRQIMTILLIGLIADVINTWIQNAGILRWYVEKRGL